MRLIMELLPPPVSLKSKSKLIHIGPRLIGMDLSLCPSIQIRRMSHIKIGTMRKIGIYLETMASISLITIHSLILHILHVMVEIPPSGGDLVWSPVINLIIPTTYHIITIVYTYINNIDTMERMIAPEEFSGDVASPPPLSFC